MATTILRDRILHWNVEHISALAKHLHAEQCMMDPNSTLRLGYNLGQAAING